MIRDAVISDCTHYRYRLYRQWEPGMVGAVMWIMLNPSTADASIDDATIRRCIAFSKSWGYGAMWVGNLYALRSRDPATLLTVPADYARGDDNARHLRGMAEWSELIVCAWGAFGKHLPETMSQVPRFPYQLTRCLGLTKHGRPKHPLYVNSRAPLQDFVP